MRNFETEITVNVKEVYDSLTLHEKVEFVKTAIDNMHPTIQKEIFGYFLEYIKKLYDLTEIEKTNKDNSSKLVLWDY